MTADEAIHGWLDPMVLIALVGITGTLFMAAIGGFIWLIKLDWRLIQQLRDINGLRLDLRDHLNEAEKWKVRIGTLEGQINSKSGRGENDE